MAVLPHLFVYAKYHNFRFFSNYDDQIYSAIAKTAFFDHGPLREPYTKPSAGVPSLYAPLIFVPYSALTRALGLLPVDVLGIMRLCGGLLLGIALTWLLYVFLEDTKHRIFWVLVCGSVFLCDSGTMVGRTLIDNFVEPLSIHATGWPKLGDLLIHFRVAAILLCLPFLLLFVAALNDVGRISKRDVVICTAAFVALIYSYFYYWVAAAALLGVLIAVEIVRCWIARERLLNSYVLSLAIILTAGLAIGAPQIYANAHTFADPRYLPILQRLARGQSLLPNDPIRFVLLRNYWVIGKLVLGAIAIAALRLWRLRVFWILAVIGYLLTNLAVFVKIYFENHHWVSVTNPITELMSLILLAYFCERFFSWRFVRVLAPCLVVLIAIPGAAMRGMGTLRADWGKDRTAALQRILPIAGTLSGLGPDCTVAGTSDDAEAAFQLSRCAMLFSNPYTALITPIPDREVNERHALNYWLEGWTLDEYRPISGEPMSWNPFGHPEWQPQAVTEARTAIFAKLATDSRFREDLMARYTPTHLVLAAGETRTPPNVYEWRPIASVNGVRVLQLIHPERAAR
jgi:hypothetical protein